LQGYQGPVALMSFNPHTVARLAELAPHLCRGIVTCSWGEEDAALVGNAVCDRLRDIPDFDATGSSFISHEAADLRRPRVAELKAKGAAILCWTVRSPEAEVTARQVADNVTFEGYAARLPA
jgi:glycerophosphoryl diester phosphodiesterase